MADNVTVSVTIPTYHRPLLLRETVESVWRQTALPNEILIGDDSKDDLTEDFVTTQLAPVSPVPIRYFHHRPSLREAANVDFLFGAASSGIILHLHDDDPIYPQCIEWLREPFLRHAEIVASFGLQRLIDENGERLPDGELVNEGYLRTSERAGLVDGFLAGAVSMFPNNGFMVRKDAALTVGYNDHGRAGLAADFYFGFRLGKLGKPFYFVPEFTAQCRITKNSLSRAGNTDNAYRTVRILLEELRPEQFKPEIEESLRKRIPIAITTATRRGERSRAFKWLFSKYYRNRLLTPRGIKRLLLAVRPW